MSALTPNQRPQQSKEDTLTLLKNAGITDKVALVGIRGYYFTMGDPNKNDRGIYDDAIFLVAPEAYVTYNANCDPSKFREGIANLKTGVWRYKVGIHGLSRPKNQQYTALVQAAEVTVKRDKKGEETGWFGINIHRGGYNTTSSLGCQTIHPTQWDSFIALVQEQLKIHGQKTIPYLLLENG